MILGLDPGLRTGWALSNGRCGTIDLRSEYAEDQGKAGALFARRLADVIVEHGVCTVVIERPFGRHPSTEFAVYLARRAHEVAWVHHVRRHEFTPSGMKKLVAGDGRAAKAGVMAAVERAGRWAFTSDHEADAAALVLAFERMSAKEAA
jgi:Holliday junction resolvasome RuvABC endonuclease subunit